MRVAWLINGCWMLNKKYNYYENQTKNAKVQRQAKAPEKKVQMCC
jgi:hypothetical protein